MGDTRAENRSERDRGRDGPGVHRDESVELARSSGVRSTNHHVLAGARHSDSEQDLVRWISRSAELWRTLETAYAQAVGADEPRGARKVSPRRFRGVRSRQRYGRGIA